MEALKSLIQQNELNFVDYFGANPAFTSTAPGRINIIGEHTDYNMGLAMPAAIDRWILVSIGPRKDLLCNIFSKDFNSRINIELDKDFIPSKTWQQYVFGTVSVIHNLFDLSYGFNALISGNIPIGAGLSSSGALEVALMNAFRSLYKLNLDDLELIKLCQKVEHEHLHIHSGLLDQFASQFSRLGQLMVIDFAKLECDYFDANMGDFSWVVVDSSVKRELAHSKYMERVNECKKGSEVLQKSGVSLNSFRDITEDHLVYLSGTIYQRIKHYINENSRVLAAKESILQQDFLRLGSILNESHHSLKTDYEVSCDELDFLVETAIKYPGCVGGRMMGGGFGGCTLNLVRTYTVTDFMKTIKASYWNQFSKEAQIYEFKLVDGAHVF